MSQISPLEIAQQEAVRLLKAAGGAMGINCIPSPVLRFRPDGKGGELATPAPRQWAGRGTDPIALAEDLAAHMENSPWFERAFSSGAGWLGLDFSPQWRQTVLNLTASLSFPALNFETPPQPDFPAMIPATQWRLACLLDSREQPDPALAARRDGGNPAFRLLYAPRRRSSPSVAPSRQAVNILAQLPGALTSRDPRRLARLMLTLTDLSWGPLSQPVYGAVCCGLAALGLEAPRTI